MKKLIIYFITVIFLISCGTEEINSLKRNGINGDVKEISQEKWSVSEKFGEFLPKEKIEAFDEHYKIIYNSDGNLLENWIYNSKGNLEGIIKSKWNNYKLIKQSLYNNNGDSEGEIIFEYEDSLNLNNYKKLFYDKDGNEQFYLLIEENENGNVTSFKSFLVSDSLLEWSVTKYDDNNHITEEKLYNQSKELKQRNIYKTDIQGNIIKKAEYDQVDSLIKITTFEYELDNQNNWIKQIVFENDKALFMRIRTIKYANETQIPTNNEVVNETSNNSIKGLYKSNGEAIYSAFEFAGESTVIVYGMGMKFPSSYVKDGELLRITTDKSDLLLKIKDNNTLIGEGFASGTYIKE